MRTKNSASTKRSMARQPTWKWMWRSSGRASRCDWGAGRLGFVLMTAQLLSARFASLVAALFFSIAARQTGAQTLTPAEEAEQKKIVAQEEAKSRLSIYGWVESGFTGN